MTPKIVHKTVYVAADGSEHSTMIAAAKRDLLIQDIERVMDPLGDTPEGVIRSKGWVQHDLETVHAAREGILALCREAGMAENYGCFNVHGRDAHPLSIIGRILDDTGGPLNDAWRRFMRIDVQGREHQQCYFAYTGGPDRGHICVEDRRRTNPNDDRIKDPKCKT